MSFRPQYILSALALGGIIFATVSSQGAPMRPIEEFVLFASEKVHLAEDIQSLRGTIGANEEVKIAERVQVSGDVLSDLIQIAEDAVINGDVFAKQLKLAKTSKILGASSTTISFPVAQIPEIPSFVFGTQEIKTKPNEEITISPGDFRDLEIGENSKVIFQPGTYNLRLLKAKENSKLVFESGATLNIAEELHFGARVLLFSQSNQAQPADIRFQTPSEKTITFGSNNDLFLRLIAPNAKVSVGEDAIIRGNIWAKEISVGDRSALRDTPWFSIQAKPEDVIQIGQLQVYGNVVEVLFSSEATREDAERIAQLINGKIKGFGPTTNVYGFFLPTRTPEELQAAIDKIKALNDPKIDAVSGAVPLRTFVP